MAPSIPNGGIWNRSKAAQLAHFKRLGRPPMTRTLDGSPVAQPAKVQIDTFARLDRALGRRHDGTARLNVVLNVLYRDPRIAAARRTRMTAALIAERRRLWPGMQPALRSLRALLDRQPAGSALFGETNRLLNLLLKLYTLDPTFITAPSPSPADVLTDIQFKRLLVERTSAYVDRAYAMAEGAPRTAAATARILRTFAPAVCRGVTAEQVRKTISRTKRPALARSIR